MWTLDSAKPFSVYWLSCSRPLRGLTTYDEHLFLGLNAPGFTLPPASQAHTKISITFLGVRHR